MAETATQKLLRENAESRSAEPVTPVTDTKPADSTPRSLSERATRRLGSDILQLPAVPGAVAGFADAALDHYVFGQTDSFTEAMMNDEGREVYKKYQNAETDTQRILAENALGRMGSDSLRFGLQFAADMYDWSTELVDAQEVDGRVPLDEEVAATVAGAVLAAPLAPLKGLQTFQKVAKATTSSPALSTGLKTLEVISPITVIRPNATRKQAAALIGMNAAVGTAMDQGARALTGEQTIISNGDAELDADGYVKSDSTALEKGVTAGGIGALGLGIGMMLRPNQLAKMNKLNPISVDDTVQNVNDSPLNAVAGYAIDDKAIIKDAVRDVMPESIATEVDDAVRTAVGAPSQEAFKRVMEFGNYGNDVTGMPIQRWQAAYSEVDPMTQKLFDLGYEARDELYRRSQGVRSDPNIPDSALQSIKNRAFKNPQVRKLAKEYEGIMRNFTRARFRSGIIDKQQMVKEMDRVGFMHVQEQPKPLTTKQGLIDKVTDGSLFRSRGPSTNIREQQAKGGVVGKVPASQVLPDYVQQQVRTMRENEARRIVMGSVAHHKRSDGSLIAKQLDKPTSATNTVTVFENGKQVSYEVGDKRLVTALKFRPRASIPVLSNMRKWLQMGTTGNLNPMFAPMSLMYDMSAGFFGARTSDMITGLLDQRLAKAGASPKLRAVIAPLTRAIDTFGIIPEGLFQNIKGRWLQEASRNAVKMAYADGTPLSHARAEKALSKYYDSRYARMHDSGYAPNSMVVDYDDAMTNMSNLRRKWDDSKFGNASRVYVHVLETIREAYRMGMFSRNVAFEQSKQATPLTTKQLQRIGGRVRDMGADITRQSTNDTANAVFSTIPYANTIVQSTAHLINHAMTNPAAQSTFMALIAARWAFTESMSDEARSYIDERIPGYERTDSMYIETAWEGDTFNPDTDLIRVPLGPETGIFTGLGELMAHAFMGTAADTYGEDFRQRARGLVGELFGISTPSAVNVWAASTGRGRIDVEGALDGRELFRQSRVDSGEADARGHGMDDGIISDKLYNMFNAILGTTGRTIGATSEAVLDGADRIPGNAWDRAMDVATYEGFERQRVGQWLTDAEKQQPRSTPLTDRMYELDQGLNDAAAISRAVVPSISSSHDADLYAGESFQIMARAVKDPVLAQQAHYMHRYLLSHVHADDMKAIGQLKYRWHRTVDGTVEQRNTARNTLNTEIMDRAERVLHNWDAFETTMKKNYGEDWTLPRLIEQLQDNIQ